MRVTHRTLIFIFFTSLILTGTGPLAHADTFTAAVDGGWKDPATWGFAGYARDGFLPGIVAGRLDLVIIPSGITVDFEGDYLDDGAKTGGGLTTIEVYGHVKGAKGAKSVKLRATEDINVLPSGEVGDSDPSAPKQSVFVKADSNVTIQGKVNSHGRSVTIEAGKDITIAGGTPGGRVASGQRKVTITSKKGNITVGAGAVVAAGDSTKPAHVWINAGFHKKVDIQGRVESGKDIHINTLIGQSVAGNVVVGPQGAVIAKGEVKIRADTLRVQGRIEGHTVQKTCKVLIIEGNGTIVQNARPANRITNKALDKWKAEQRQKQEAAERAERIKSNLPDFCIIDMNSVGGTVLEADESVRVAGGVGSTLDLTGNPAGTPVIVCPGSIEIFVDQILLDPGVLVEDLCGPGAVVLGPPGPTYSPACIAGGDTVAYPGIPGTIQFQVTNMGFDAEMYEITLSESLGWDTPPTLPPLLLGGAVDPAETLVTIPFDPPPWSIPDVDTNKIVLTVRSTTDPFEEYSETYVLPVADITELKAVHVGLWGLNPAPGGAVMGIEHWLANNGSLDDDFAITVSNLAGWPLLPHAPDVFIAGGEQFIYLTEMEIPNGTPDGFPNEVYFTAVSLTSPGVAFTDTVPIFVNVVSATPPVLPPAGRISHRAHPNPFNPKVTISFAVPAAGDHATVTVYDVNGRRVRQVFDGAVGAEGGECSWDGTDSAGRPVGSGVYFYRITAGGQEATGKAVLAK